MTSCRRGRPLPPPSGSVPTLDLHGHTKTAAIRSATAFLAATLQRHVATCPHAKAKANTGASARTAPGVACRCPVPCHLVTGSGSHSASQGGPVVRPAIAALLRRRCMAHHLTPRSGRGGFTVDANSGRELVYVEEGRRACTKVVVASSRDAALGREDWPDLPIHSNAGGGNFRRRHDPAACVGTDGRRATPLSQAGQEQRTVEEEAEQQQEEEEEEVLDVFPLPSEVAADDSVLADIKSRSAAEAAQKRARADRERNQLQKAMEQSHDEAQKQQEREEGGEKEEREELVRALRLSREESMKLDILEEEGSASTGTSIDEMDDEEFDRLLEASRREEEEDELRRETQEREELERALQLSQQVEVERNNVDNDDEEDEELLKVLALSERESRRQSLAGNENNIEEEEEEADLRRAMEESLAMASEDGVVGLDGIAGTGHLTDDEEAMIRQALEQSQL